MSLSINDRFADMEEIVDEIENNLTEDQQGVITSLVISGQEIRAGERIVDNVDVALEQVVANINEKLEEFGLGNQVKQVQQHLRNSYEQGVNPNEQYLG